MTNASPLVVQQHTSSGAAFTLRASPATNFDTEPAAAISAADILFPDPDDFAAVDVVRTDAADVVELAFLRFLGMLLLVWREK